MEQEVPIAEKALLTIREAADYYNLGLHKLRELTNDEHCPFVLWNGNKRLIKRKAFEEFLNSLYSDLLSLSIKQIKTNISKVFTILHKFLGTPHETGLTISNYIRKLLSLKKILVNIIFHV